MESDDFISIINIIRVVLNDQIVKKNISYWLPASWAPTSSRISISLREVLGIEVSVRI